MFCPSYRTHGLPYSSIVWKTCFAIMCQLAILRNKCSDIFCHVLKRIFWRFNMFWCTSFPMFHHVPQCSARIQNKCSVMFNHVRACYAMFHLLVKERISFIFKVSFFSCCQNISALQSMLLSILTDLATWIDAKMPVPPFLLLEQLLNCWFR